MEHKRNAVLASPKLTTCQSHDANLTRLIDQLYRNFMAIIP